MTDDTGYNCYQCAEGVSPNQAAHRACAPQHHYLCQRPRVICTPLVHHLTPYLITLVLLPSIDLLQSLTYHHPSPPPKCSEQHTSYIASIVGCAYLSRTRPFLRPPRRAIVENGSHQCICVVLSAHQRRQVSCQSQHDMGPPVAARARDRLGQPRRRAITQLRRVCIIIPTNICIHLTLTHCSYRSLSEVSPVLLARRCG